MPEQKKTEEQIRHDMRRRFGFSEKTDQERIDKAVEMEKDRFKAVQKKQEIKSQLGTGKPEGKKDPEGNYGENHNYSLADIRALSDVHDDDVDRITKFAKSEDITIAEAKSHTDMKAILKNRAEVRKTAEASNSGPAKRGASKVSGADLLDKARKGGDMPEDDASIDKLLEAKYQTES